MSDATRAEPDVTTLDLRNRGAAAMLAAAYGDALGWPIEPRGARVGGTKDLEPSLDFVSWTRREGGRYAPHERHIPAGMYSDDTQLLLAVGRSLSSGYEWWQHLTEVELPLWAVYELGGGGAVKRAANSWAKRMRPWSPNARDKDRERYFSAGANGVVMRILPHGIHGARGPFARVAETVMADGITTHGHPRALVGALAFSYAQWRSFRRHDALGYGELVDDLLDNVSEWARLPQVDEYAPDWARSADQMFPDDYTRVWDRTVEEMCGLLLACRKWLDEGSLARDQDALRDLGAYGKEGGAGTRTAAAAIYFAARYAARPPAGLLASAFARRTDADTIACATGSLLGAIAGLGWIREVSRDLRDAPYIATVGTALASHQATILTPSGWEPNLRRKVLADVARTKPGHALRLPVFGRTQVIDIERPSTRSANSIGIWWLESEIGQTIAMTKVSKPSRVAPRRRHQEQTTIGDEIALEEAQAEPETPRATAARSSEPDTDQATYWVLLRVSDLRRTIRLYQGVLKMPLSRETGRLAVFGQTLAFLRDERMARGAFFAGPRRGDPRAFDSSQALGVVLPADDFHAAYRWLDANEYFVSDPPTPETPRFRFIDHDGHVVEVAAGR